MKMSELAKIEEESRMVKQKILNHRKSSLVRYQELAVGQKGLIPLLKYEILTTPFIIGMPSLLGYYLRNRFAKFLFGEIGSNCVFGNYINVSSPHKIKLGNNVLISDNCKLDVKGGIKTDLIIGDNVLIGKNTVLRSRFGGSLKIGNNVGIGDNCIIAARDTSVKLGDNVLVSAYCYIMGGRFHNFERNDIPIAAQPLLPGKGVVIEDNVWLGGGVKVLDGITIGRDSIVGAGAVVTKDIPEFCIAVGVPAKVVKKRR